MAVFNSTTMTITGPIQHKRGTTTALEASSYVPAAGELLVATDTGMIKAGDGTHTWSELPTADATEIANNYTETVSGKALDAVKGKELNERLEIFEGMTGIDCGEITAETQEEESNGE